LVATRVAVQAAGIDYDAADIEFLAAVSVSPELEVVSKVLGLIDALDDCDDVQNVFTNMEPSAEVLEALDKAEG
jgi:transcriptional/translational regulatory protein YebC/TACO1